MPSNHPSQRRQQDQSSGGDADWWRRPVVYQVYPRSFQDSNDDGIGDLPGIISRLDYLNDGTERSLGVDAIWLSPTFPSPMKDFGYDVSDYEAVHPNFGTLADMDALIAGCHERGMKLLLDYVPNHTSDAHPWFIESRSSRENARRDWYIWKDPGPDGSPPNNWLAVFGGSAWELDETTGQYYLHSFLTEQPDLNWRNPDVVQAMHDVLRFWLERGIDGFRIDVMGMVLKHPDFPDNPPNPLWEPGQLARFSQLPAHNLNHPDVFGAVRGIRSVLDEYGAMAVGEVFGTGEEISQYYGGESGDGLHLAFDFRFIREPDGAYSPWDASYFKEVVADSVACLPASAQPCYAFDNHDRRRLTSRFNEDGRGQERARAAALLLLGLRGTPFLYYGAEIGMVDVDVPEHLLHDPARFHYEGRDPERTPMQWDSGPGRGFSRGEPWLPFGPVEISVESQQDDPSSLLSLHRRAIWIRKRTRALQSGTYRTIAAPDEVFAFVREYGDAAVLVAVNTSLQPQTLPLDSTGTVLLATDTARDGSSVSGAFELEPLGAAWIEVAPSTPAILTR